MSEESFLSMPRRMRAVVKDLLKRGADVYELEATTATLRRELEATKAQMDAMQALLDELQQRGQQSDYDLVRMSHVDLYMPTDDNLYRGFVPESCKHISIEDHRRLMEKDYQNAGFDLNGNTRHLLYKYVDTICRAGQSVKILDLGAWVGDFAVGLARFAHLRGLDLSAQCYDPSAAGRLILSNAELNDVADRISFYPFGISRLGGPQVFRQLIGHSDASRLAATAVDLPPIPYESSIVRTLRGGDVIPSVGPGQHLIVKIDIEGNDAAFLVDNMEALKDATIIFELAPTQGQWKDIPPVELMEMVQNSHDLFDIVYLPRPSAVRSISKEGAGEFLAQVFKTPYGYTDILAVPHSLSVRDELIEAMAQLTSLEPSYMMA